MAEKQSIKIEAELLSGNVESGLNRMAGQIEKSMESATRATSQLADGVKAVGDGARVSAGQILGMANQIVGMGGRMAVAWAELSGIKQTGGIRIGTAAFQGAAQGATAGLAAGGPGAAVGALVGGATAGLTEWFGQEQAEKAAEEARQKQKAANDKMLAEYDRVNAEAEKFSALLARIADTSEDAAARSDLLARSTEDQQEAVDSLRRSMIEANNAMDFEAFGELTKLFRSADQRLRTLRNLSGKVPAEDSSNLLESMRREGVGNDALTRLGLFNNGQGGAASMFERQSISLAEKQLEELRKMNVIFNARPLTGFL
ncbi:MAG: hypothetical protein ACI4QT_07085 [Kiritimatiellia bacterium]